VEPAEAAQQIERWFKAHARDLPWRGNPDPYRTLVVEFLLQQTRIETGIPYYHRFLDRFPDIQALARAPESEVLRLWSGLGYYRRARNLHRAAQRIVAEHGGRVPDDPSVLDALPGIGPYTAGAVASIAYDRPEPCIDGNHARVIGRFLGVRAPGSARGRRRIEAWARRVLRHGSPRSINQALMDLGAGVCLARVPRCGACPLASACRTRPRAATLASAPRRPKGRVEDWEILLHVRGDRLWLRAPTGQGLLGDVWTPPARPARTAIARPDLEHVFSHRTWRIRWVRPRALPKGAGQWVRPDELERLPHGPLAKRAFEAAAGGA
jgi:A/G-specific adenine glycosylase